MKILIIALGLSSLNAYANKETKDLPIPTQAYCNVNVAHTKQGPELQEVKSVPCSLGKVEKVSKN